MRLRHAFALALVGWYLMVPPVNRDSVNTDAPIARWRIVGSFDKAVEYEGSIEVLVEGALKRATGTA